MAAHQAPPSLGFSRQEHWSGLPFPSPMQQSEKGKWSRSVMSNSLRAHGLQPTRFLHPWDFPGKSTGVGCHCLLHNEGERGELKAGLTLNIKKTEIMASGPITSWQIDGKKMETTTDYFLELQNHCRWWLQPWIKRCLLLGVKRLYIVIGEGNGNPLQYSCLENHMDRKAW